jgi:deferrochelatase/peroxidase EfeB
VIGSVGAARVDRSSSAPTVAAPAEDVRPVPFEGPHQAGVLTSQQQALSFAAFDFRGVTTAALRELLEDWTAYGRTAVASADGTSSRLSLTLGFGPALFGAPDSDRLGLASARPPALIDLPAFDRDQLEPARSGGDLCVQCCGDDPQVTLAVVRDLVKRGRGAVVLRWLQHGFSPRVDSAGGRTRNLLGFRDGTNNLDVRDAALLERNVWVGEDDGPAWMVRGTYMVVRRIRMRIEHWDSVALKQQEHAIGRHKLTGAPLGLADERARVVTSQLPLESHVRQANPSGRRGGEEAPLRRSYSFADGIDPEFGELDAGLFFICFQRDPRKQFVPIQQRLSQHDRLNEYIVHTGSAIFAIPPGVRADGFIGSTLLSRA